jgi:hypothetical protein
MNENHFHHQFKKRLDGEKLEQRACACDSLSGRILFMTRSRGSIRPSSHGSQPTSPFSLPFFLPFSKSTLLSLPPGGDNHSAQEEP